MSRPSVMRFGSQPDLGHGLNTTTTIMAGQASLPDISLYKFAPQYPSSSTPTTSSTTTTPALPRARTSRTSSFMMKPQLSWNSLKRMFGNSSISHTQNEEVKHASPASSAQQTQDPIPSTSSQSDNESLSQDTSSSSSSTTTTTPSSSQDSSSSNNLPTPINTPPTSPKAKGKQLSRQDTEIAFQSMTFSENMQELSVMKVKVRDYAYPSTTTPAPFCNTPAPPLSSSSPSLRRLPTISCQFADPSLALAELRYRIRTNSRLSIRGQKARWLIDMGWVTEEDQKSWRESDWEALRAYDAKPEHEKPRFWVTSKWNTPLNARERETNDFRWTQACHNIETHELAILPRSKRSREEDEEKGLPKKKQKTASTSHKKRGREDVKEKEKEGPERKKLKIAQSTVEVPTPASTSAAPSTTSPAKHASSKPVLRRRRKVPLPPISAKQYPCPIEYYDPEQYDHEEIRLSQETMRRREEAEANEGPDAWEMVEDEEEDLPSSQSQTSSTPPSSQPMANRGRARTPSPPQKVGNTPPDPPTPEIPSRSMPPPPPPSSTSPSSSNGPVRRLGLRRTETLVRF